MNAYHEQLEVACRAVRILSPTRYLWLGRPITTGPTTVAERRAITHPVRQRFLLASLEQALYANFYCQGTAAPLSHLPAGGSRAGAANFVARLSAANVGAGCWEDGWVVSQRADGDEHAVLVAREGDPGELAVRAWPGEYLAPHRELPNIGAPVRLHLPNEYPGFAPGFYTAASDAPIRPKRSQRALRLYWHVTPAGAVRLMALATAALNAAGIPFRLKVLDDPVRYTRCDAAVLYIYEYEWNTLAGFLARLHAELATELTPTVPAFTKALGPGLGLAEDPPGGESFGLHRSGLVAAGLVQAYERGETALAARVSAAATRFAEEGIHLEAPFLNPDSAEVYAYAIAPSDIGSHQAAAVPRAGGEGSADRSTWLAVAARIGQRLVGEALWHRGRCNWVGPLPEDAAQRQRAYTLPAGATATWGALGPEVYAGTSGIALFLATLAVTTDDASAGRTAAGAMRQALARADAVPPAVRLGLYSGWSGMMLAAAQIGLMLDREDLVRGALDLLRRFDRFSNTHARPGTPHQHDLISGGAGAIVALVALARLLSEPTLLARAVELGDDLLRTARVHDESCSWPTPDYPHQRHLTGLGHGAAGIGCALLELWAATEKRDYLRAAQMAFHYERTCFDPAARGWPDFRGVPEASERARWGSQPVAVPCVVAWCHGAAGIALARLRAGALAGGGVYRDETLTALDATAGAVRSTLAGTVGDFSLCHGLAGCADILLAGSRALGPERDHDLALVQEVAAYGVETFETRRAPWPCGSAGGEVPGLLRGLAGIGTFYLRLSDPDVPSVLLPLHSYQCIRAPAHGVL